MFTFRTLSFITVLSLALAPASTIAVRAAGTMPACAPGDHVVWENTSSKSKAYHLRGDRYFGATKHGAYACQSDAERAGYHAAKMRAGKAGPNAMGGDSADTSPQSAPMAGATATPAVMTSPAAMTRKHHRRKHRGMMASPDPSAT